MDIGRGLQAAEHLRGEQHAEVPLVIAGPVFEEHLCSSLGDGNLTSSLWLAEQYSFPAAEKGREAEVDGFISSGREEMVPRMVSREEGS